MPIEILTVLISVGCIMLGWLVSHKLETKRQEERWAREDVTRFREPLMEACDNFYSAQKKLIGLRPGDNFGKDAARDEEIRDKVRMAESALMRIRFLGSDELVKAAEKASRALEDISHGDTSFGPLPHREADLAVNEFLEVARSELRPIA